jgi:protein-S-isoprenylcysteine O-methyltransferase Ste14
VKATGAAEPSAATRSASVPRAARRLMVRVGNFLFTWRNDIFPLTFLVIAATSYPHPPFGSERADLVMDAIGLSLALAGQVLRAAVIGLAYIQRGGKAKKIHADTLVEHGLFAHSRNPLYLGNMMIFLGLFVVLNSYLGYLVGIPFFLLSYLSITLAEEEYLKKQFGIAFVEYCQRVNRFIPTLPGLGATMRSMSFNWRRLVRKEYGSTFTWITTAIALLLWERAARHGWNSVAPRAWVLAPVWALTLAGYALARYLKKSDRLKDA